MIFCIGKDQKEIVTSQFSFSSGWWDQIIWQGKKAFYVLKRIPSHLTSVHINYFTFRSMWQIQFTCYIMQQNYSIFFIFIQWSKPTKLVLLGEPPASEQPTFFFFLNSNQTCWNQFSDLGGEEGPPHFPTKKSGQNSLSQIPLLHLYLHLIPALLPSHQYIYFSPPFSFY